MSKFGGALKKLQTVQQEDVKNQPDRVAVGKEAEAALTEHGEEPDNLKTSETENLKVSNPESRPLEREKYSTYLDAELITSLKLYAVRQKMKHHHVVEAALRAYLKDRS